MSISETLGLTLTESAVQKIKDVLEREECPSLFKVSVRGGGCAGFKYEFATASIDGEESMDEDHYQEEGDDDMDSEDMDDESEEDEEIGGGSDLVLFDGFGKPMVLIDSCSQRFLRNSTIDYVEDMNGSRFVVNNPVAKSGCGCGNSFSL